MHPGEKSTESLKPHPHLVHAAQTTRISPSMPADSLALYTSQRRLYDSSRLLKPRLTQHCLCCQLVKKLAIILSSYLAAQSEAQVHSHPHLKSQTNTSSTHKTYTAQKRTSNGLSQFCRKTENVRGITSKHPSLTGTIRSKRSDACALHSAH